MTTRGSLSYIWFVENYDAITGKKNSHVGRFKRTGEEVFLKEISGIINKEDLTKVDSKNIIKFYNIENDTKSIVRVLAFEYCEEGSVNDMLMKPENFYGLDGQLVIQCCIDVAAGLCHLKENKVHNEKFSILPTNVMCKKHSDGSFTFKVGEFYYPVYNVYKSPYQISVIEKKNPRLILQFSLAVLLIQMITGRNPFGKRKLELELLLQRKQSEICLDFNSHWIENFPLYCQLDSMLKCSFKEIIDKLFNFNVVCDLNLLKESLKAKADTTFYYFFDIFLLEYSSLRLKRSDTVSSIQKSLNIDLSTDKLIFDHSFLKPTDRIGDVPQRCSKTFPILIYRNASSSKTSKINLTKQTQNLSSQIEKLYNLDIFPVDPGTDDCKDDEQVARIFCAFIALLSRVEKQFRLSSHLLKQALLSLEDEVDVSLQLCSSRFEVFTYLTNPQHSSFRSIESKLREINLQLADFKESNRIIENNINNNSTRNNETTNHATNSKIIPNPTTIRDTSSTSSSNSPDCGKVLQELLKKSMETYVTFRNEAPHSLSHNGKQIHRYMKVKLKENVEESSRIFIEMLSQSKDNQQHLHNQIDKHYKDISSEITLVTKKIISCISEYLSKEHSFKESDEGFSSLHSSGSPSYLSPSLPHKPTSPSVSSEDSAYFSESSTTSQPSQSIFSDLVRSIRDKIDDLEKNIDDRQQILNST